MDFIGLNIQSVVAFILINNLLGSFGVEENLFNLSVYIGQSSRKT